jgi:hypothetical protein
MSHHVIRLNFCMLLQCQHTKSVVTSPVTSIDVLTFCLCNPDDVIWEHATVDAAFLLCAEFVTFLCWYQMLNTADLF